MSEPQNTSDTLAQNILTLVADYPAVHGRLRTARLVKGFPVPLRKDEDLSQYEKYQFENDWPLKTVAELIDALITGGLLVHSAGSRPKLVLTRSGYAALRGLEAEDM